jgi:hypothetical protein
VGLQLLSAIWGNGSIVVTMRATVCLDHHAARAHWLVILCLISQIALRVEAADGSWTEPMPEGAPIVVPAARLTDATRSRVTVRVYSSTSLDAPAQRAALDVANAAFQAAWIDVEWKICALGGCDAALTQTDLAVRMVTSGDPRPGVRPLGDALIDRRKGIGVLATVYVDRTQRIARELAIDHGRLLGRAVAHEIGHLLLASTKHGSGLMREVWSHDELLRTQKDDWVLHAVDARAIRQRLASVQPERLRPGS